MVIIRLPLLFLTIFAAASALSAQLPTPSPTPEPTPIPSPSSNVKKPSFIRDVLHDQKVIWTSPFRLRAGDAKWFVPAVAVSALAIGTDERTSSWIDHWGTMRPLSRDVSYAGSIWSTAGISSGLYFIGKATKNKRLAETGRLSFEALLNSAAIVGVVKHITRRPRPNLNNGEGTFFWGGRSFPSGHSSSAWSVATVVAYEYHDKPLVRYGAWGAAALVTTARYTGRYHFLSEVLLGSALGFYTGRFVYKEHHHDHSDDPDLEPPPAPGSRLLPTISPIFNGRTATYGAKAVWSF